jgi:hypothetical protein
MPSEIFDVEKFVEMSDHAEYCSVKRLKETVKLKLCVRKRSNILFPEMVVDYP